MTRAAALARRAGHPLRPEERSTPALATPAGWALRLQRLAGNRAVSAAFEGRPGASSSRADVAQLLRIDEAATRIGKRMPATDHVSRNWGRQSDGGRADLIEGRQPEGQAALLDALSYAAGRFEPIGNLANAIVASGMIVAGVITEPRQANQLDPFVYEIEVPYRRGEERRSIALTYLFAATRPGYIIRQRETVEGSSEISNASVTNPNQVGYAPTFFSTHAATGKTALAEIIEQDPGLSRAENEHRADARTKLAGEGARFNFVKTHAGKIADESRIYTVWYERSGWDSVWWTTFRDIWTNWRSVFGSAYGISDDRVARALIDGAGWRDPNPVVRGMFFAAGLPVFTPKPRDIEVATDDADQAVRRKAAADDPEKQVKRKKKPPDGGGEGSKDVPLVPWLAGTGVDAGV